MSNATKIGSGRMARRARITAAINARMALAAMTSDEHRTADTYADTVAGAVADGATLAEAMVTAGTATYGRQATADRGNVRRMIREQNEAHGRIVAVVESTPDAIARRVAQRYGRIIGDAVAVAIGTGGHMTARCEAVADRVADVLADDYVTDTATATAATFARIHPAAARRMRAAVADHTAARVYVPGRGSTDTATAVTATVAALLADGPVGKADHDPATCRAYICRRCHGAAAADAYRDRRDAVTDEHPSDAAAYVAATVGTVGPRPAGLAPAVRVKEDGHVRPTMATVKEETSNRAPEGTHGKAGSVRIVTEGSVLAAMDALGRSVGSDRPVTDTTGAAAASGHRDPACEALAVLAIVPNRGNRGSVVDWQALAEAAGSTDAAVTIARRVAVALADRHDIAPDRVAVAVAEACDALAVVGREKREAKRAAVSDAVALANGTAARRVDRMTR